MSEKMTTPLGLKRRRIDEVTNTLKKPFVSPLRAAQKTERAPLQETDSNAPSPVHRSPYIPSIHAHTTEPGAHAEVVSQQQTDYVPAKSTPIRKYATFSTSAKRPDPEEIAMQRSITALELQTRRVQNDIDALQQADQISNSSTDADLEALVDKWRLASQAVAEDLFGTVKERVYRMGGVAAWKESEKNTHNRFNGQGAFAERDESKKDDADCEFDSQGEELPEDEQEYRKKMKRKARQEMVEAADVPERLESEEDKEKKVWQEDGLDDDVSLVSSKTLYAISLR